MDFFRLATSSDKNYVLIGDEKGKCHAHMGMAPSNHQPQPMSLGSGCVKVHATIIHEFFHAFGIFHTHQRPDRNDYITVYENNIVPSWRQWYKRLRSSETDETISGIPYDARSFMHYRGYPNTIDKSKPAITSKVGILISNDSEWPNLARKLIKNCFPNYSPSNNAPLNKTMDMTSKIWAQYCLISNIMI